MKKTLALLALLVISVGAMAQVTDNNLLEWIEELKETYYIDNGICIAQQAILTTSVEDSKQIIKNKYSDCQIKDNGNMMIINGQLKKVRSDVYEDLNELVYLPQYTIEITLSDSIITTMICVNSLISEMPSFSNNIITNIYPINESPFRNGKDDNKARKIITNEGYIFCRTIEAMRKKLTKFSNILNLAQVTDIVNPNDNMANTNAIDFKDDAYLSIISIETQIKKYADMSLVGEAVMIGGAVIAAGSAVYNVNKMSKHPEEYTDKTNSGAGIIVGGAIALGGYIVKLCAYSELKKIQVQGSSVVYKF